MRTSPIPVPLAVAALVVMAASLSGQALRLTTPTATLREEFSDIRGVRELPDGRLLVSDYIDQRVVVADFDKGTVTPRVTKGGGPKEARLPTRLIPIPGDSTLLTDLGNNRLLLLDNQGRPVRTIPAAHPGILGVRGIDAAGAFYFAIPGWAEPSRELPNDSIRIVLWNPRRDAVVTVAVIQGDRMRSDIREPALVPRIPTVGYAAQDAWVMDGGTLRIVRGGSYRVESLTPGGKPVIGPSYAWTTRAVSAADRLAYVRDFTASTPTSGKGENGGMGYSPTLNDKELGALTRGTQFADRHPMFDAGAVRVAPAGRLWVGRSVGLGAPMLYDIFDQGGRRVATVTLPAGRKVAAIGQRAVYLIADDEGVQRLERYPLPR